MSKVKTRIAIAATVASAVAATALFGGTREDSTTSGPALAPAATLSGLEIDDGSIPLDTTAYVETLERRVAADPEDGQAVALLGVAYQQQARETGDPSYYGRSEKALRRAVRFDDQRVDATLGLAALAASRHRFHEARVLARRVLARAPANAEAYGVLGDALLETGRYRKAFAAFERMVVLKPDVASYARIAYAREILGRRAGAIEAMELAVTASTGGESAAWALVQLGNLYFEAGRLRDAERAYRAALVRKPRFPSADGELAHIDVAEGRLASAARRLRRVVAAIPSPDYATALGDVLTAAGKDREADEAYALVESLERMLRANGVRTELEIALFDLDHGGNVAEVLGRVREAHRRTPTTEADDILSWALYRNGRCGEARRYSARALRLGTKDATVYFHRGMIERCLGDASSGRFFAQALAINPHFSILDAAVARRLAEPPAQRT
jgi:tetratricopeptide (TPR) repeat protein